MAIPSSANYSASSSGKEGNNPRVKFIVVNKKTGEQFIPSSDVVGIEEAYSTRVNVAKAFGGSVNDYDVRIIPTSEETRADRELSAKERADSLGIDLTQSALAPYQSTAQMKKGQSGVKEFVQDVATFPIRSVGALPAALAGVESYKNAMGDIDRSAMLTGTAASLIPGGGLVAGSLLGAGASELASEEVNPKRMALMSGLGMAPAVVKKGVPLVKDLYAGATSRMGNIPKEVINTAGTPEGFKAMRGAVGSQDAIAQDLFNALGSDKMDYFPEYRRFVDILGQANATGNKIQFPKTIQALHGYNPASPAKYSPELVQAEEALGVEELRRAATPFQVSEREAESQFIGSLQGRQARVFDWLEPFDNVLNTLKSSRKAGSISPAEYAKTTERINRIKAEYGKGGATPRAAQRDIEAYKKGDEAEKMIANEMERLMEERVEGYAQKRMAVEMRDPDYLYPTESYQRIKSLGNAASGYYTKAGETPIAEKIGNAFKDAYRSANDELYEGIYSALPDENIVGEMKGIRSSMAEKVKAAKALEGSMHLPKDNVQREMKIRTALAGLYRDDAESKKIAREALKTMGDIYGKNWAKNAELASKAKAAGMTIDNPNLPWYTNTPTGLSATALGSVLSSLALAKATPFGAAMIPFTAGAVSPRVGTAYMRGLTRAERLMDAPLGRTAMQSVIPLIQQEAVAEKGKNTTNRKK